MVSTVTSKLFRPFINLFKKKLKAKHMDNFSQEYLDKLLNREKFLRTLMSSVNKKVNHPNWVMRLEFGVPVTLKARDNLMDELAAVCMEIDFLVGYLKE